jgi:hypothetical protein
VNWLPDETSLFTIVKQLQSVIRSSASQSALHIGTELKLWERRSGADLRDAGSGPREEAIQMESETLDRDFSRDMETTVILNGKCFTGQIPVQSVRAIKPVKYSTSGVGSSFLIFLKRSTFSGDGTNLGNTV